MFPMNHLHPSKALQGYLNAHWGSAGGGWRRRADAIARDADAKLAVDGAFGGEGANGADTVKALQVLSTIRV